LRQTQDSEEGVADNHIVSVVSTFRCAAPRIFPSFFFSFG
jgi:hypothetical protein